MQWFQARKAQKELTRAKIEIASLKQQSEYEKFLDEQLREKALEFAKTLRESQKLIKLAEADRRNRQLREQQREAYQAITEGAEEDEDFDDDEEEEASDPMDRIAENLISRMLPAPVQQTLNLAQPVSDIVGAPQDQVKKKAHAFLDKMPSESLKEYAAMLKKKTGVDILE